MPGTAIATMVACHRIRCYECRSVWIVQPAQILRYRRYEAGVVAPIFEAKGAGLSWSSLEDRFPEISSSVQRGWVSGLLGSLERVLQELTSWAASKIPDWLPPNQLRQGGLEALLAVVASLQEWEICPASWLEWLHIWNYRAGSGHLILATKCRGGRSP